MVQAVEVILPLRVDDLQHDVALDATQDLDRDQAFFLFVLLEDDRPEGVGRLVDRHRLEVGRLDLGRFDAVDLGDGSAESVESRSSMSTSCPT